MQANGYIFFSKKTTQTGGISSCNGAMTGLDLLFFFSDCSESLNNRLMAKDVTGVAKQQCGNPPPRAIKVGFDIEVRGNRTVAINIIEI